MASITYKTEDTVTNINNIEMEGCFLKIRDRGVLPDSGANGAISLDYDTWAEESDITGEIPFKLKNSNGNIVEGISNYALSAQQKTDLLSENYFDAICSILTDVLGYTVIVAP